MKTIEEDFRKIFKTRFNELRGEMTQAQFAEFLGISRPTVGFYENGERIPDALTLKKIVNKCGVTADYLLGETDTPYREHVDIVEKTGLKDKAIANLSGLKELSGAELYMKYLQDVINLLLMNWSLLLNFNRGILDYAIHVKQLNNKIAGITNNTLPPENTNLDNRIIAINSISPETFKSWAFSEFNEKKDIEEWKLSKNMLTVARTIADKLIETEDLDLICSLNDNLEVE